MAKENVRSFTKKGVKSFLITYEETNILIFTDRTCKWYSRLYVCNTNRIHWFLVKYERLK